MKVLMSIKPEFANLIFKGEKGFEYRKAIFKNPDIKTIIVYASSPVQKVIGEFDIEDILSFDLDTLWNKTQNRAGISKDYFQSYFSAKEMGYAIKIGKKRLYRKPKCLSSDFGIIPPQSFAYVR